MERVSLIYREEARPCSVTLERASLLYIQGRETPSLTRGENVSLLYREETGPFLYRGEAVSPLYRGETPTPLYIGLPRPCRGEIYSLPSLDKESLSSVFVYIEERYSFLFTEQGLASSIYRGETLSLIRREGVCLLSIEERYTFTPLKIRSDAPSSL